MNRKVIIFVLIPCGLIGSLWIIGRLTNALQLFSTSTTSNYPTIKSGEMYFGSNLIKPKRFDFICYYAYAPEVGRRIWTHRLCGLEGDKIEIKSGNLYVNDQSVDDKLSLSHSYLITATELSKVKQIGEVDDASIQQISYDTMVTYLSDQIVSSNNIKAVRQILPKDYKDQFISILYSSEWNQDNFGPLIVPKNKYFVLGDNRLYSQDSRYLGLIDETNYVATVLGRK